MVIAYLGERNINTNTGLSTQGTGIHIKKYCYFFPILLIVLTYAINIFRRIFGGCQDFKRLSMSKSDLLWTAAEKGDVSAVRNFLEEVTTNDKVT